MFFSDPAPPLGSPWFGPAKAVYAIPPCAFPAWSLSGFFYPPSICIDFLSLRLAGGSKLGLVAGGYRRLPSTVEEEDEWEEGAGDLACFA